MAYIAMWAAFGGFILLISLINLFVTGDADALPRR